MPSNEQTRRDMVNKSVELFRTAFGAEPACIASAPGRVNLIGEHTDYNNGYVLPAAINRTIAVAASSRSDGILSVYSHNQDSLVHFALDQLEPLKEDAWANYIAGVAYFLRRAGLVLDGANLCIVGDIPQAAGLSSSAALEVANANALSALCGGRFSPLELIKICRQAENDFVGVSCGIMDQFVATLGKAHHAVFLDCHSLEYEYVALPKDTRLLVCDTGVKRELTNTEYNRRRQECFFAVKQLSSHFPMITSLRNVSLQQLEETKPTLDPVIWRRARHVIGENQRVLDSVAALKVGNLTEFGKLMYESHLSLKLDFEVSCPELDAVVDICAEGDGVYGARMTGAGFGGAAICLVDERNVDEVKARLEREYPHMTGRTPTVHVCSIEDGATILMA